LAVARRRFIRQLNLVLRRGVHPLPSCIVGPWSPRPGWGSAPHHFGHYCFFFLPPLNFLPSPLPKPDPTASTAFLFPLVEAAGSSPQSHTVPVTAPSVIILAAPPCLARTSPRTTPASGPG